MKLTTVDRVAAKGAQLVLKAAFVATTLIILFVIAAICWAVITT